MSNTKSGNKLLITSIIVVFLSPVVLSWLVFHYTDFIKIRGTANNGTLILPSRPIANLALIDPLLANRNATLHGKWNLVYIAKTCDASCIDNIYRLRQIHSAMDKHSLRVQKVLILTEQDSSELTMLFKNYPGQQIISTRLLGNEKLLEKFKLTNTDNPLAAGRTYIIDPLGNLMMYFQPNINPRDIMADLKKLLRASRIG